MLLSKLVSLALKTLDEEKIFIELFAENKLSMCKPGGKKITVITYIYIIF